MATIRVHVNYCAHTTAANFHPTPSLSVIMNSSSVTETSGVKRECENYKERDRFPGKFTHTLKARHPCTFDL